MGRCKRVQPQTEYMYLKLMLLLASESIAHWESVRSCTSPPLPPIESSGFTFVGSKIKWLQSGNLSTEYDMFCLYSRVSCYSEEVSAFSLKPCYHCFSVLPQREDSNHRRVSLCGFGWKLGAVLKCSSLFWGGIGQMADLLLTCSPSSCRQLSWSVHFRSQHQFATSSGPSAVNVWTLQRSRRSAASASSTRPRWRLSRRSGCRSSQVWGPEVASALAHICQTSSPWCWFSPGFLDSEIMLKKGVFALFLRNWSTSVIAWVHPRPSTPSLFLRPGFYFHYEVQLVF